MRIRVSAISGGMQCIRYVSPMSDAGWTTKGEQNGKIS